MRLFGLWAPVAGWMALIFGLSAQSNLGPAGSVPDWITHGSAYLILSVLLCRALAGGLLASGQRGLRPISSRAASLAVLLACAYGVSDEFHQALVPGRDPSASDVAKDTGGALLGAGLFRLAAARRLTGAP